MLTRKQHELLSIITDHLARTGISPSFEEMKAALGLRSKSGVHRLITALEERGFIRRLPHRARALEVLKLPEDMAGTAVPATPAVAAAKGNAQGNSTVGDNVIAPDFRRATAATPRDGGLIDVPMFGRIAAGTPIEAIQTPMGSIPLPESLLGSGEFYALEISGDSMIGAGIHDGDTAIIRRCDAADNGAIVVALIDEQEATLKRIRRKGKSVALEAANPAYETRIFGPDRVRVQGRLAGVFRRY